jgi:hypothetical protein
MSLLIPETELYRALLAAIQQFSALCHHDRAETAIEAVGLEGGKGLTIALPELQQALGQIQVLFQTQILTQSWDHLDQAIAHRIHAINVEISKQLRLLKTDLIFLGNARQADTWQKRYKQICDRMDLLEQYCEAILSCTAIL